MRQSLVQALSDRKEDSAVNKLLDIVKNSTDTEVRRYTIQVLLGKNDPVITKKPEGAYTFAVYDAMK